MLKGFRLARLPVRPHRPFTRPHRFPCLQVWIIPLIIWYILSNTSGTNCSAKRKYTGAVSGLFIMFCCSFVLEVAALWIGLRGTMFERSKRRPLPTLVYLDLVSHLLQIGFNAYATWANLTDKFECILQYDGWNGSLFMWFITIVTWVYMALFLLFLFIFFNPRSDYTRPESWEGRYMFITWMGAMCCCWNPFSAKQRQRQRERARRVGANLCSMFGHVDLTVTDALAAFALARNMYVQERKRRKMATSDVSKDASGAVKVTKHGGAPVGTELAGGLAFPGDEFTAPKQQEASKDGDSMGMDDAAVPGIRMRMHHSIKYNAATLQSASMGATIAEANHFFKFAFAAYGWMLYLLDGGIVGPLLQLCTGWGARGQYGALGPCCSGKVNKEVALKVLDASPAELLFLREEGALVDVLSYLIAVDHDTKSIVFSIRGELLLPKRMVIIA